MTNLRIGNGFDVHAFEQGRQLLVYQCHLVKRDMMLVDKVSIYLFENSQTGHVEAQMFLEDIAQEYLDSITNDILYQKDYMLLSVISLDRQIANLRCCRMKSWKSRKQKH